MVSILRCRWACTRLGWGRFFVMEERHNWGAWCKHSVCCWSCCLAGPIAEHCSLTSAVTYIRPLSQVDPASVNSCPVFSCVGNVFDLHFDAEAQWNKWDISPSSAGDVDFWLCPNFALIRENCIELPVKAPTGTATVFKPAQFGLNTHVERRELVGGADRLHRTLESSKEQLESLQRQVLPSHA